MWGGGDYPQKTSRKEGPGGLVFLWHKCLSKKHESVRVSEKAQIDDPQICVTSFMIDPYPLRQMVKIPSYLSAVKMCKFPVISQNYVLTA